MDNSRFLERASMSRSKLSRIQVVSAGLLLTLVACVAVLARTRETILLSAGLIVVSCLIILSRWSIERRLAFQREKAEKTRAAVRENKKQLLELRSLVESATGASTEQGSQFSKELSGIDAKLSVFSDQVFKGREALSLGSALADVEGLVNRMDSMALAEPLNLSQLASLDAVLATVDASVVYCADELYNQVRQMFGRSAHVRSLTHLQAQDSESGLIIVGVETAENLAPTLLAQTTVSKSAIAVVDLPGAPPVTKLNSLLSVSHEPLVPVGVLYGVELFYPKNRLHNPEFIRGVQ